MTDRETDREDEYKTVEIAAPLLSYLQDQKTIRKLDSISAVISRIISEKRDIEVRVSMLEDEINVRVDRK